MDNPHPGSDFWKGKYRDGDTPWDLGKVSTPVKSLVAGWFPPRGRVFVPCCGRGYETVYLAQLGYRITALDIAEAPLTDLRWLAEGQGVTVEILHGDMFAMASSYDGIFDVFLEQTCLCALSPQLHAEYEALAYRLLRPGGQLLGVFMEVPFDDGPPFDLPPQLVMSLFWPERWRAKGPEPVFPPNPARPGPEYLAGFTRRGSH